MPGSYTYSHPRPMVTVDVVVLRVAEGSLQTVLVRRGSEPSKGRWALPGGFMEMHERLADAAARELREETGIDNIHLDVFGIFDAPDRDPRGRVISVAHVGLIGGEVTPQGGDDAAAARWVDLNDLPELAFDHAQILDAAIEWLAGRLGLRDQAPAGFTLLAPDQQSGIRSALAGTITRRRPPSITWSEKGST